MATKTNKEAKATTRKTTKKVSVQKVDAIKTVSVRKRKAGLLIKGGLTSKINLVRLTRNENYLPNNYKTVLDMVRKGYATSRELADVNPLKRAKASSDTTRNYYYRILNVMADIGLLNKERHSYHNGITCIVENKYTVIELEPIKMGPGQYLDVNIRLQ